MKIYLGLIVIFCITFTVYAGGNDFLYEKMHNFGLGRRVIPNYKFSLNNKYAVPEPLPTSKSPKLAMIKQPYRRIHQGFRRRNMDKRVYRREFDYPAHDIGQRIKCESLVNCTITYITVDVEEGLPIIFRGGAGYRHFTVLVRANPGDAMKGTISVFCDKTNESDEMAK